MLIEYGAHYYYLYVQPHPGYSLAWCVVVVDGIELHTQLHRTAIEAKREAQQFIDSLEE